MADQAEITRHSHPLGRIVICCTSVPPESRQALAKKAHDMGARHVLDLTSDVTHLVCGDIATPKYKYVAKMRTDVKVMKVEWVDAMYGPWIDGEDIDPRDYEEKYKLPILYRLSISVTGILDVADRKRIEELVVKQEASYHPDLTRHVTHLIAAAPTGKKYEFARNNNINVVVEQWLDDSLERGMALEESCYDPRLPEEKIGAGARPARPPATSVGVVAEVRGKRKIRKRAEDMLGSQSQGIWGDILGQASNPKPKKRDEWEENSHKNDAKRPTERIEIVEKNILQQASRVETKTGIFASATFYVHGYTKKQGETIRNIITDYDGNIASSLQDLKCFKDSSRVFLVVPHTLRKRDCPDISDFSMVMIVTEWWVEACMYKNKFIEASEGFVYSPFEEYPLEGFEGLEICLTQFSGIELLHMRKLITLLGGSFQDFLSKKRHLVITDLPTKGEKFDFAIENNIPVVTAEWFQECLKQSKAVPFTGFLVKEKSRTGIEIPVPPEDLGSIKRARDIGDSGDNKRPRLSGINFQGGKLLGENLQSFGDRLKRRIPDEKTRADADAKTSGPPSNNRNTRKRGEGNENEKIGRCVSVQSSDIRQGSRINTLDECVVCVSKQLKARSVELNSVAKSLGASVVESFSQDDMVPITHLIHSSKSPQDTSGDFKVASAIDGCHIVPPDWLYKCQKLGERVDEKAYPRITTLTRGFGMGFKNDSSSSLSPVDTMAIQISSALEFKVERKELDVNKEDETGFLPQDEAGGLTPIYNQPGDRGPTPPTSAPMPTIPLPLDARRNPAVLVQPTLDKSRVTTEPPEVVDKKAPASLGNILGKLGKGELTTAMERRKPRGKLQGRATENLSSYNSFSRASSVGSSRAGSVPPSQQGNGQGVKNSENKNLHTKNEVELPAPSQAIRYADPEAEYERKNVRAKLSGDASNVETPKPAKATARRIKTAVDVEGSGLTARRTKRNK